jgi:hypothetical protein
MTNSETRGVQGPLTCVMTCQREAHKAFAVVAGSKAQRLGQAEWMVKSRPRAIGPGSRVCRPEP